MTEAIKYRIREYDGFIGLNFVNSDNIKALIAYQKNGKIKFYDWDQLVKKKTNILIKKGKIQVPDSWSKFALKSRVIDRCGCKFCFKIPGRLKFTYLDEDIINDLEEEEYDS